MKEVQRTVRQQISDLLEREVVDARGISQRLGIREKEVYEHLVHIRRSLKSKDRRLEVTPATCLGCGHEFRDRQRLTPPGRCPRCRGTHLTEPAYRIV